MDNKKNSIGIIHKIKHSLKIQIIICITLCLLVIGLFLVINNSIPLKYTIINDITLINQIENVDIKDNKTIISGYAFILNKNSNNNKISLLLRNVQGDKEIWAGIEQTVRKDINEYYDNSINYENSGFIASIKNRNLEDDKCYEILVRISYNNMDKTVSTKRYLMNGEFYSYNPFEFDQPDINIESRILQEVFNNGKLCFYNKSKGMYVYQYMDKLYWVANEQFAFDDDGLTRIPYHLYILSMNSREEDKDNFISMGMSFYFEENEYKDEKTNPYRLAIKEIPKEYSIAYITTGVYDTTNKIWFWDEKFHLYHDFR